VSVLVRLLIDLARLPKFILVFSMVAFESNPKSVYSFLQMQVGRTCRVRRRKMMR
jgi:hypothetical protein